METGTRLLTPAGDVMAKHMDGSKDIKKYMRKWHDQTMGELKGPAEGTFDVIRA